MQENNDKQQQGLNIRAIHVKDIKKKHYEKSAGEQTDNKAYSGGSFILALVLIGFCLFSGIFAVYTLLTHNALLTVDEISELTTINTAINETVLSLSTTGASQTLAAPSASALEKSAEMSFLLQKFADNEVENYLFVNLATDNADNLQSRCKAINILSINRTDASVKILTVNKDLYAVVADYDLALPKDELANTRFHEQKLATLSLNSLSLLKETLSRNFYLPLKSCFVYSDQLVADILQTYGNSDADAVSEFFAEYYAESLSKAWSETDKTDRSALEHAETGIQSLQTLAFYKFIGVLADNYDKGMATTTSLEKTVVAQGTDAKSETVDLVDLLWSFQHANDALNNYDKTALTTLLATLKELTHGNGSKEALILPVNKYYWVDDYSTYNIKSDFNLQIPGIHKFLYNENMPSFEPIPKVSNAPIGYYEYYRMPAKLIKQGVHGAYHDWPLTQAMPPAPAAIYPEFKSLNLLIKSSEFTTHDYLAQKGTLVETLIADIDDIKQIKAERQAQFQAAHFALPGQGELSVTERNAGTGTAAVNNDIAPDNSEYSEEESAIQETEAPVFDYDPDAVFTPEPVFTPNPVVIPD